MTTSRNGLFSGRGLLLVLVAFAASVGAQAGSGKSFEHTAWTSLLKTTWKGGRLPYKKLKADSRMLDRYLGQVAAFRPASLPSRDEKLAFWINAYNACTLRTILDSYPLSNPKVDAIALKSPAGETWTIWQKPGCKVGGKDFTLDQIEKEVLIGELNEPLVHFAINCGAISCPLLRAEAYEGKRLRKQLREQVVAFLADSTRNQFDAKTKTAKLSMIFGWYAQDFEKVAGGNLAGFLAPYVPAAVKPWISAPGLQIEYLEYDWTLNDL